MSQTQTYEIDLPQCFAEDHYSRDLPSGELVRQTDKLWTFICTSPELREWRSDANHYSVCAGQGWDCGPSAIGLQSSAQATVKRIDKLMAAESIPLKGSIAEGDSHGS